ncbi:MAG: family 43 glycosylhydrolase [Clostridia bacterium]|nr:family 43 glycosylhydrolase [Clostridia bacterium]
MNTYKNPFIPERADPFVTKGDSCYYFTASYPAYGAVDKGYDRIILRKSETVAGLAEAEEKVIWKAHESGIMARHIWAPEIHKIGGVWYAFFAAGNKDDIWHIRPYLLKCKGNDPYEDEWQEMGIMQASDGDDTSFTSFSLDMTHFEHKGKHYLIWAEILPDSSLFMAEINPENPQKLITKPILLTKPEYDWEKVRFRVNEGAAVLKSEDKIIVFFSASGTGSEYCMGMVYMDSDKDPMVKENWTKVSSPVLSTEDLQDESGPGHNSFVYDEDGRLLLVYHARPMSHLTKECGSWCEESLYDPCRHARIRFVTFDENNLPIIER